VARNSLSKKLLEMGLTEEQVMKILESYRRRIEKVKEYQKERYFKVSITVRKDRVKEIQQTRGVNEKVAKKIAAYEKLVSELQDYFSSVGQKTWRSDNNSNQSF